MSDLRERLIQSDGFGDALSELRADRALAVFAAWLRERADTEHDPNCTLGRRELQHYPGEQTCAHFDARWRRDFAITLADEIDPREASDGE